MVDALEVGALSAAICAAVAGGLYGSLEEAVAAKSRITRRDKLLSGRLHHFDGKDVDLAVVSP